MRHKEIINESKNRVFSFSNDFRNGFIEGAKWGDITLVEHFAKWIENNINDFLIEGSRECCDVKSLVYAIKNDFIKDIETPIKKTNMNTEGMFNLLTSMKLDYNRTFPITENYGNGIFHTEYKLFKTKNHKKPFAFLNVEHDSNNGNIIELSISKVDDSSISIICETLSSLDDNLKTLLK